jgi:hypothetical protein
VAPSLRTCFFMKVRRVHAGKHIEHEYICEDKSNMVSSMFISWQGPIISHVLIFGYVLIFDSQRVQGGPKMDWLKVPGLGSPLIRSSILISS